VQDCRTIAALRDLTNSITRYNHERQLTVSANTRLEFNTSRLIAQVVKRLGAVGLPPDYRFAVAGDDEAKPKSFGGLLPA
jgi:multidrug efflux pump subunit AcrB